MEQRYSKLLVALRTSQQFLDANNTVFGSVNATSARQKLDSAVEELRALAVSQDVARSMALNGRQTEFSLLADLKRQLMRPVEKIAKVELPKETALGNIHVPPTGASTITFATRARAFATFVDAHEAVFHDLGPSLSQRLRDAATALEDSITGKGIHRGERVKATSSIPKTVAHIRRVVALLDVIVKAQFAAGDPTVVQWRDAVRVIRGGTSAATGTVTPAPAPAPTPAPAPAPVSTPAAPEAPVAAAA
jgi:hypothetical protein